MRSVIRLFTRKSNLLVALLLFAAIVSNAQLKIGDNPTVINKSSILELESSRQGLLLPRLADTAAINLLTPPDGMLIYLTSDSSLRVRRKGAWRRIADSTNLGSTSWSLTGNTATDSALNFIGTVDGKPLTIKTANQPRLIVGSNGNVGIGTTTPTAKFQVSGSVKFDSLALDSTQVTVLVLAADGSVLKRNISSAAFANAIRAINGIQAQTLSIKAGALTTIDSIQVVNTSADSTIAINLPVQDGSSLTKPYGLLTLRDWQKIDSAVTIIAIGAVSSTPNINGASIAITNDSTRTITLHAADATNPGILTAGTQTLGGNKTFADSLAVNGTLTLNNVQINNNLDSVLVIGSNGLVQKRKVSEAAFGNAIRSINANRDTAQIISFRNTGTDLTVSTNALDSIFLNVPNADTAARGVVTTTAQTYAGAKIFRDSLSAAATMIVGARENANSTMQVSGSLSLAIRTVSVAYTATSTDNTILVNTTTGALTLTLPIPTTFAGRVYTIKKIGTGGIDNALTITPTSATIDGGSSYIIYNDWTNVTLQTDGTNWFVIRK